MFILEPKFIGFHLGIGKHTLQQFIHIATLSINDLENFLLLTRVRNILQGMLMKSV